MSDSLRLHELQHGGPHCLSLSPRVCANSCSLSQWCYLTISSSVTPSSPVFNLLQHQGLSQWVSSLRQVAKVLEFAEERISRLELNEVKSLSHVRLFATPWTTRLLCPWDSSGRSTGVGCHFLLQGIFLTQGSNPGLLHCKQTLYHLSHQQSPRSEIWT